MIFVFFAGNKYDICYSHAILYKSQSRMFTGNKIKKQAKSSNGWEVVGLCTYGAEIDTAIYLCPAYTVAPLEPVYFAALPVSYRVCWAVDTANVLDSGQWSTYMSLSRTQGFCTCTVWGVSSRRLLLMKANYTLYGVIDLGASQP